VAVGPVTRSSRARAPARKSRGGASPHPRGSRPDPIIVSTTKEGRNPVTVKLRLMRMGKKKAATYRVVVADSRRPEMAVHRGRRHLCAPHGTIHHRDRQCPSPGLAGQGRSTHRDCAKVARDLGSLGAIRVEPPPPNRSLSATPARAAPRHLPRRHLPRRHLPRRWLPQRLPPSRCPPVIHKLKPKAE